MSTVIKLKNSSVSGKAPGSGDLSFGELALNFNDGRLYYKNASNVIEYFSKAADVAVNFDVLRTDLDAGSITDSNVTNTLDLGAITGSVTASYDLGLIAVSGVITPNLFILPSFSTSSLPSVDPAGQMIFVTDEVGGSIPAFSDGANWRRVSDRQIVS